MERGGSRRRLASICSSGCHDVGSAAKLTLDLLAGPAGRLNGPRRKFAVGSCVLDHGGHPLLSESLKELAIGVGVREIAEVLISFDMFGSIDVQLTR